MNFSRRSFLQKAAVTGTAAFSIPAIVDAAFTGNAGTPSVDFPKQGVVLFQGDSITDAGREKTRELPNNGNSFGTGYAFIAASALLRNFPDKQLSVYNRGISGNKVFQLAERWEKDCLSLKPDVLSILIGVNDYWHMRNGKYEGTVEVYEADFRKLLQQTLSQLPGVKLVVCQPFILTGTSAVDESWVAPFTAYQEAAYRLAKEFSAVWVPFQKVFDEALQYAPAPYWAADGVHPSMAGCQLMAATWLRVVEGI